MSVLLESPNRRLYTPADVFGGRFRHPCHGGCGNVMVVPDPETEGAPDVLREGQIWGCRQCFAAHEYYMVYIPGVRMACVRLFRGPMQRESFEPKAAEFAATAAGLESV
jgi:hypothetical protein